MRALLFAGGILLLVWIPFSYLVFVEMRLRPFETWGGGEFLAYRGVATIIITDASGVYGVPPLRWHWSHEICDCIAFPTAFTWFFSGSRSAVSQPIWLMACLCLAWPAASFILGRQRHRTRGFEVTAKESLK